MIKNDPAVADGVPLRPKPTAQEVSRGQHEKGPGVTAAAGVAAVAAAAVVVAVAAVTRVVEAAQAVALETLGSVFLPPAAMVGHRGEWEQQGRSRKPSIR